MLNSMEVKSRRQDNTAATRAAVVAAAAELFASASYQATSIDDVAAAARVSKGAVYHHFHDKRQLFETVFRDVLADLLHEITTATTGHDNNPWDRALAGVDAFLAGIKPPTRRRILFEEGPAALGYQRHREIDNEMALPLISATIQSLIAHGYIAPIPVTLTTRVLLRAIVEAGMAAYSGENPDPDQARQVIHRFLTGLRQSS